MEDSGSKNGRKVSKRSPDGTRRKRGDASPVLKGALELIEFLKLNKVEYYRNGDIEIKLNPASFIPQDIPEVTNQEQVPSSGDELTDELLFYSAPGRPQ
jgi:hypothetical protein